MQAPILKISHGKVITPGGILSGHDLLIQNGKILEITNKQQEIPGVQTLDAQGCYVAPGCIDTHLHGGGGHDFMEATPEAFYAIAKAHARYGMTALYPTIAAASMKTFYQAIDACEKTMNDPGEGAQIMGLHLEGNYLNKQMKGGQNPDYIYAPDPKEYKDLLERTDCIKRWSASPELAGALDFGRYATQKGVLVSLAHTTARYELVKEAFDAGYTHATHFYNAMTSVHKAREYKYEGTIEAIYLMDDMTVELVTDGIHVPPAILKLAHKLKGVERTSLVTDAMSAAAWPDGDISTIDPRLIIEDGVSKLADRSALASSIATADRMIRTMVTQADVPLTDAVRMAAESPARVMGILDRKGSLEKGKDADIILFDPEINIRYTLVGGKIVFQ
ncbi:N-acetylglucosamine-6-phosphate deacetylase [Parabacteroides sp. PF5-9]|uniref:N-acetylglucosamine-6-phosphate deacetylase n=1 Tax=Parabacteroides sp. PF5-9 TaxID=1742404 RepID=UPI0024743C7E|nr:N-acetylglucosamine-6-phosphate deacetylase [Parabacteroides sp. PF5-9]MDH6356415.1 N-acetylglucosamine-6-phosphate deacetylase [Parabacteroides sp. PF5-9]